MTHNIAAFQNVPVTIPYRGFLSISGEAFIHTHDFEKLNLEMSDTVGAYRSARNLASGSVCCLEPEVCAGRKLYFNAFRVLEGLEDLDIRKDSKEAELKALADMGFDICDYALITPEMSAEEICEYMKELMEAAENSGKPIDGLVASYDSIQFSESLGRTSHHYKDGLAYKFEDETFETVVKDILWQPSRTGLIVPVAVFDTVTIDGREISKATIHNFTRFSHLMLEIGDRILVSTRNMIIPHIEKTLEDIKSRGFVLYPFKCPCCGSELVVETSANGVENLFCNNEDCSSRRIHRFVHFVSKKAMDIQGLSAKTLEKLMEKGFLDTFSDIYELDQYREDIVSLPGFGEKKYENLWKSIQYSRITTLKKRLISMDIPLVGNTASGIISDYFKGDVVQFEKALITAFQFFQLEGVGDVVNSNIQNWFLAEENGSRVFHSHHWKQWCSIRDVVYIKLPKSDVTISKESLFAGKTIVATGKLENFTRKSIQEKIISLGAKPASSVSSKTDYVLAGKRPAVSLQRQENWASR